MFRTAESSLATLEADPVARARSVDVASFGFRCTDCDGTVPVPLVGERSELTCPSCKREFQNNEGILLPNGAPATDSFSERAHALLAEIETEHFWYAGRARFIVSTLREALGPLAGRTLLDIGCGTGFVLGALESEGMLGCGVDMDLAALRHARRRVHGPLLCETVPRVSFRDEFDAVTLCDVLEHVRSDVDVLYAASASLKPYGVVVATVPAHPGMWTTHDEIWGHKRRYTKGSLVAAMREADLRVRLVRHFNTLLMPAQVLHRLRFRDRSPITVDERISLAREVLQVPARPLNALFRMLTAADHLLSRLPINVGSSLIAIGYRDRGWA